MSLDFTPLAVETRLCPEVHILWQELPDKTQRDQPPRILFSRVRNSVDGRKNCFSHAFRNQWTVDSCRNITQQFMRLRDRNGDNLQSWGLAELLNFWTWLSNNSAISKNNIPGTVGGEGNGDSGRGHITGSDTANASDTSGTRTPAGVGWWEQ